MSKLTSVLILPTIMLLAACGGGGSGDGTLTTTCSNLLPVMEPPPAIIPVCTGPTTSDITLSGTVQFQRVLHSSGTTPGLDYSNIRHAAVRGVTVQLVNSNTGAVLASTSTDANGFYTFNAPSNTAVYVMVRAEMINSGIANWNVRVVDNTRNNALYTLTGEHTCTETVNETRDILATHGWIGSNYNPATRMAGPFAILDTIYQGILLVTDTQPSITFPPLVVNWSANNSTDSGELVCGHLGTSFFNPNNNQLYLLGREDNDTDEYDQHVIAHEWAHYLEFNFSRTDSIGGFHTVGDRLDMRVAFGEGYGNALAGIILDDPIYKDAIGIDQASGFGFSVETEPLVTPGWYSEQSVEQILYDLYDSTNESGTVTDNITLGFAPLWNVLINKQRNDLPLTSIFSFITALKDTTTSDQEISDLVNNYNINGTSIDAYGTTETNDASTTTSPNAVLPVYTDLMVGMSQTDICVTDEFDRGIEGGNSLGMRRFLRFTIAATGNYRFTATHDPFSEEIGDKLDPPPPADPDIALHQAGLFLISEALGTSETFCQSLSAGEYILELYDYSLFTPHGNTSSRCFNVSVVGPGSC